MREREGVCCRARGRERRERREDKREEQKGSGAVCFDAVRGDVMSVS